MKTRLKQYEPDLTSLNSLVKVDEQGAYTVVRENYHTTKVGNL